MSADTDPDSTGLEIDGADILSESEIHDRVRFWVLARSAASDNRRLHVPAHDTARDDPTPEPSCTNSGYAPNIRETSAWITKDAACFPVGYAPVCKRCRAVLDFGREIADDEWGVYE